MPAMNGCSMTDLTPIQNFEREAREALKYLHFVGCEDSGSGAITRETSYQARYTQG